MIGLGFAVLGVDEQSESARRKMRLKRGGQLVRSEVDVMELPLSMPEDEVVLLDDSLHRLCSVDARAADIVKLCFFVGLTQEEAARELGISLASAERSWSFARAWLFRDMERTRAAGP
ncbi:MAG: ECF-type sigma factor [Verrucomicrobiota bacterium]